MRSNDGFDLKNFISDFGLQILDLIKSSKKIEIANLKIKICRIG